MEVRTPEEVEASIVAMQEEWAAFRLQIEEQQAADQARALEAEQRFTNLSRTFRVFLAGVVVILVSVGVLVSNTTRLAQRAVDEANETQDRNNAGRSIVCRQLLLLGGELKEGGPCMDPEVLEYYDPNEVHETSIVLKVEQIRDAVCLELAYDGIPSDLCN